MHELFHKLVTLFAGGRQPTPENVQYAMHQAFLCYMVVLKLRPASLVGFPPRIVQDLVLLLNRNGVINVDTHMIEEEGSFVIFNRDLIKPDQVERSFTPEGIQFLDPQKNSEIGAALGYAEPVGVVRGEYEIILRVVATTEQHPFDMIDQSFIGYSSTVARAFEWFKSVESKLGDLFGLELVICRKQFDVIINAINLGRHYPALNQAKWLGEQYE